MLKIVKVEEHQKVELFGDVYEVRVPNSKESHNHAMVMSAKPHEVTLATIELLSACGLPEKKLWECTMQQLLDLLGYVQGDLKAKKK